MKRLALLGTVLFALASSHATQKSEREYDFAFVRDAHSVSSWGDWSQEENQRFRDKGKGLYVRKDGTVYVISDAETLRQADDALNEFHRGHDKAREQHQKRMEEIRKKDSASRSKQQSEFRKKIQEESSALAKEMRDGRDTASREHFRKQMSELREKMHQEMQVWREQWKNGPRGKELQEYLGHMREGLQKAEIKITSLIDRAFDRGLAKKI